MENMKNQKYLELLAQIYPNVQSVATEIINLKAILDLPKGTEHFISDIHGEYNAFNHILSTASGVIREKIEMLYSHSLCVEERNELAILIYYTKQKLENIKKSKRNLEDWYKITLIRVVEISKLISSKYTRSKVRKAMPKEFAYVIDELLHNNYDIENKQLYYERIINTIIDIDRADDFIIAISKFIKTLAVDHLHIVGDIFDRGSAADKILTDLMEYHSLDIQWGNHDILWMGAASGSAVCIATILNISMQYNNLEVLECGYGINLRPLAIFAQETYGSSEYFAPKLLEEEEVKPKEISLISKIHKAIAIIQFKLEGQIILRNKEFEMEHRLLLDKIDYDKGTIKIGEKSYKLTDTVFPTIDKDNPYKLTAEEEEVITSLVKSFKKSEKLQKHIRFLYTKGSLYKTYNSNLLFHGCIPTDEEGNFVKINIDGQEYSGKKLLDQCETLVRKAYFSKETSKNKVKGQDYVWYLWCGKNSPLFGRNKMTTFERYFINDKNLWKEEKNYYYKYVESKEFCDKILDEFGLETETSHIINGHMPVKTKDGENPIKAGGKLIIIDGGICKAYRKTTGIAGYTLIFNSKKLRLVSHEAMDDINEIIENNKDIVPASNVFEIQPERIKVGDTDLGKEIKEKLNGLETLLNAYNNGIIVQNPVPKYIRNI